MPTNPYAVQKVLDALSGLDVCSKYIFNGDCLYCDAKPVGWITENYFYLKNTGKNIPGTEKYLLQKTDCKPKPSFIIPNSDYGKPIFRRLIQSTADALSDKEKRW